MADAKKIEIYEFPDKKFINNDLKKFRELQEATDTQLNKIRQTIHEKNETFDK